MVYQKVRTKDVVDLYNQKNNINEIAKSLDCNQVTIWSHLKKGGINIKKRFCLDCRKNYEVLNKYNKFKRCLECQEKRTKELKNKWSQENLNRLSKLRKEWRDRNPKRKLNWINLHKDPKHINIRNDVEMLVNKKFMESDIAKKLKIKLGKDSRDRFSVKWYKKCINSKKSGKKVQELYLFLRQNLVSSITKETQRKGAFNLIKKLKRERRYKKHQSKAGKLGGLIGGPASIKKQRSNKPYYFMNVPFDSEQEKEFCKSLIKYNLLKKPIEGENVHIRVGRKEFDFLIKQKLFIEYHPFDSSGKSTKEYFIERREVLNKNGFKKYPLIVIDNFKDINKKIESLV